MDARIRTALREGGFDLYAQRISSLRDNTLSPRFEVLLRMREGTKLHTPASFFNAAEMNRLLPDVDCWVIGALMQTLTRNPLADPGLLGVNSGASFAIVWPQFLTLLAIGGVFFTIALLRFRKTIGEMA